MAKFNKRKQKIPEFFHHCMPFEFVVYDEITAHHEWGTKPITGYSGSGPDNDIVLYENNAHKWLEKQIGFYPHWCTVGNNTHEFYGTGYDGNWKRVLRRGKDIPTELRKAGDYPNSVLFSWEDLQDGVFADYGWSGWYGDFYFRSLRELSYILQLEKDGKVWKSAEHLKIPYTDWDGVDRTYRPDFIVEGKQLIEVKPKRLHSSVSVRLKCEAGKKYCKSKGLEYLLVDAQVISSEQIQQMRADGRIKFTKRYEERFIKTYGNGSPITECKP